MLGITTEILFEKFEVIEVLKKDEHAAVFLANHVYLSKKIILKVLNTQKISDQALVERFKREAKLLARLDHPNIIKVLDFGTSKEYFYISFEYIEGVSLRNLLKTKTLPFDQKKHLMVQLLKALNFAHSNQIIHRDIKPENIFIDNNLNLKLGDFGLALSAEDSFITNPYSIVGTPSYMSPEQVRGTKLTAQSDLFSAGVVLYELFTGKNPFLKENVNLTLNVLMSFDEKTLSASLDGIDGLPQEIKDVLYHMLRKNLSQRYSSVSQVLTDLNILLDQHTGMMGRDERRTKLNRIKAIAAVITLVLIVLFVSILKLTDYQQQTKSSPALGQDTSQRKDQSSISGTETLSNQKTTHGEQVALNKIDSSLIDQSKNQKTNQQNENIITNTNKKIGYGGLLIVCLPWGEVYIDGEKVETTPMNKPLTISEGEHTIKLIHPDFPVYTDVIRVNPGQITRVQVSLESLMAYIGCRVSPWGNVFVNGDYKGQTPLSELIRVVPGFIRLTIKNPRFRDIDTTFSISRGDTLKLRFAFK